MEKAWKTRTVREMEIEKASAKGWQKRMATSWEKGSQSAKE